MTDDRQTATSDSSEAPKRGMIGARGATRMRQIAVEAEAERAALAAELVAGLGRPPSAIDQIAVEVLSSTTVRARRQRKLGKSDREDARILVQAVRAFGIRPAPAAPPRQLTIAEQLAARGYAPPKQNVMPAAEPDDDDDDEEAA
jgi:hypothetical protein